MKKLLSIALALTMLASTANIAIPINAFAENEQTSAMEVKTQENETLEADTIVEEISESDTVITNNDYTENIVSEGVVLAPEDAETVNPIMTQENKTKLAEYEEMLISEMTEEGISLFSNDVSLFSASSDSPTFNQYLADYNYNYNCYNLYKNEFKMPYRSYVETRKDDPTYNSLLAAWRIATFQLSDVATYNTKEIGFYETILYDVLYQGQEIESLSGSLQKITNTVQASSLKKISKSLSKDLGEVWRTNTNDMSLDEIEGLNKAMQSCEELNDVFGAIGNISNVLGYVDNIEELIIKMAKAQAIMESSNETAKILLTMKNNTSNSAFKEALSNMILICSEMVNENNVIDIFASDMIVSELGKFTLDTIWEKVVSHLNIYGYAVSAGQAAGKLLTGLLFGTDKSVELYYSICALYEFENCLKYALGTYERAYLSNKSDANSSVFNEAYKLLLQTHLLGIKASIDVVEVEYKAGLINTLISYFKEKEYDSYMKSLNNMQSYVELTINSMNVIAYNCYLDEYGGDEMTIADIQQETPKYTTEENEAAIIELKDLSFVLNNVTIDKDKKLTEDMHTYGSLIIEGGTLDLNGHTLTVDGNILQSGGTMNINAGTLNVGGDYSIAGSVTTNGAGDKVYTSSSGILKMIYPSDYVCVDGDFATNSNGGHYGSLKDGTIEIKGDFQQLYHNNFDTSENHKVIFNGDKQQEIFFENPDVSGFANVEFRNSNIKLNSGIRGFTLNQDIDLSLGVKYLHINGTLDLNGHSISNSEYWETSDLSVSGNLILDGNDIKINGNLEISSGTIDLSGQTLTVTGDVLQSGGTMSINAGTLNVRGDYSIAGSVTTNGAGDKVYTSSSGRLQMIYPSDYVCVDGDFATYSNKGHYGSLKDGTIEIKGDFQQLYYNNFETSENHKVIFNGDKQQNISFSDYDNSQFYHLVIKNNSCVYFNNQCRILGNLKQSGGAVIENPTNVVLKGKSAFEDHGELNAEINNYVGNAVNVIPTYVDYENYCKQFAEPIPSTSVTLNKITLTLQKGFTERLIATMQPTNTDDSITWSTSNSNCAIVAADGTITAKAVGSTTITATTSSGKKAYCYVTVEEPPVSVSSVTIDKTSLIMTTSDMAQLTATVLPEDATNKEIVWTSSDESVAMVNTTGVVTAVGTGSTVITATSNNGMYHECIVQVIAANGASLVASSTKAMPGEIAEYTVSVVKNPGMSYYKLSFDYDTSLLEPIDVIGKNTTGSFSTNLADADRTAFNVLWFATANNTENSELFTIRFRVAESVELGTEIPVTMSYGASNIKNSAGEKLAFYLNNTSIAVAEPLPGDINEDGEIDFFDISAMSRGVTEIEEFTTRQQIAADVNNDGLVDIKDNVKLLQYVVGWSGVELMSLTDGNPVITVGCVKANDAGEADIPVIIKNNIGISGFKFVIDYNPDEIEILSITPNTEILPERFSTNLGISDRVVITWYNTNDIYDNGTLFTLGVKFKDDFEGQLSSISIKPADNNLCNDKLENAIFTYDTGYFTADDYIVTNEVAGDTNFSCELYFDDSYKEQSATAMIAFYDASGILVQLKTADITVKPGKVDLSIDYDKKDYATYKLMIWEDFNNMKPLVVVK